jgi:outer membrane protein OmpA-like peptidoglycan-associated protein
MPRTLTSVIALAALAACTSLANDRTYPVFFTDQSTELDAPARQVVKRAAVVARQFPRADVTVEGFADEPDNPARSATLSSARAKAVAALLVADGVARGRLKPSARGTPAGSEPGVASRRVEIDVDVPDPRP